MPSKLSTTSLVALLAFAPASAQEAVQGAPDEAEDVMILEQWNYGPLYSEGWSVEDLLERTALVNPAGEAIGDVENLIFHNNGGLVAVIAEVGGFWDLGDTHVRIPWQEVALANDLTRLEAPITEESVGEYPVLPGSGEALLDQETEAQPAPGVEEVEVVGEEASTGDDEFRATDLIGDRVYFADAAPGGEVNDLVVIDDAIAAIVVDPENERGDYYAYPYTEANGLQPHYGPRHDLPYRAQDRRMIESFDYERLRRPSG
jgi:sporulation protein YlmC with PRC-barrel domain